MPPDLSFRTEHQQHQEEEYVFPYHWNIQKNTRKGVVFFSYWERAIALAGDLRGKQILDAGCGDGFFASLLQKKGAVVTGVDYSDRAIAFACLLEPHAEFLHASMATLPCSDALFDVVFSTEVFEHIPLDERAHAVKELFRVLKPGGALIVTSPSVLLPYNPKHEEHFTLDGFQNTFAPPFRMVSVEGQDRAGRLADLFWGATRIFRNRFWVLPYLIDVWTLVFYPVFMNKAPLHQARRFIGVFQKERQ